MVRAGSACGRQPPWTPGGRDVLYEDGYIIAVNKPAGLPSQPTPDPARDCCHAAVVRYLGGGYAGMHHRLDAATSGVLLMTKDPGVNAAVAALFRDRLITKRYFAVSCGPVPCGVGTAAGVLSGGGGVRLDAPIGELKDSGRIQRFGSAGRHRKPAVTDVDPEDVIRLKDHVIVSCTCSPHTGRTHQIRVHMSEAGLPIVGDALYGGRLPRALVPADPGRMCLHAESLEFTHPVTGEDIVITAPRPGQFMSFLARARRISRACG